MKLPGELAQALRGDVQACISELLPQGPSNGFVSKRARIMSLTQRSTDALAHATRIIYGVVQSALQEHSRSMNDRAVVNNLPAELFVDILTQMSCADIIRASHVCQFWRHTALSSAKLWAQALDTALGYRRDSNLMRDMLMRTKDAPVSLHIMVQNQDSIDLLDSHLHHIKHLNLSLHPDYTDLGPFVAPGSMRHVPVVSSLMYALRNPAPVLESLFFSATGLRESVVPVLPADVFAEQAPKLRTVTVDAVKMPYHPYAAFRDIVGLSISSSMGDPGHPHHVEVADMVANITAYPALRNLGVYGASMVALQPSCRELSRTLERLDLCTTPDVRGLLDSLDDDTRTVVHLEDAGPDELGWLLNSPDKAAVSRMRITSAWHYNFGLEVVDARGRTRRLSMPTDLVNVDERVLSIVPASAFADLVSLVLPEFVWPDEGLAPMPRLRELTVYMQHGRMMGAISGIFQLDLIPAAETIVPVLHTLKLATSSAPIFPGHHPGRGDPGRALVVSAHDIAVFLDWHLRIEAERLPRLILKGVDMYEPIGSAERRELDSLVEDVVLVERPLTEMQSLARRFSGSINFRSTSWIFDELED